MTEREGRFRPFQAVVLRKGNFGEAHSIYTMLDPELGRFEAVTYGARSEKSRRGSVLIASNVVEGLLERKNPDTPWSVKDVRQIQSFPALMTDLSRAAYLYLVLEILDLAVPPGLPFPLYASLTGCLSGMDSSKEYALIALHFLVRLFQAEGVMPDDADSLNFNHLSSLDNRPFRPGPGTLRFLRDAAANEHPLFFLGKGISRSVENEALGFAAAMCRTEFHRELRSLSLFRGVRLTAEPKAGA